MTPNDSQPSKLARDKRVGAWIVSSLALGVLLIGISWRSGGTDRNWLPSTLSNLGVAVLLFAPLYWATRALDSRITTIGARTSELVQEVSDKLTDVEADHDRQLAEISRALSERRSTGRNDVESLLADMRGNPSRETFAALHKRALEERWLRPSPDARVRLGTSNIFVHVPASYRYSDPIFRVATLDGTQLGAVAWRKEVGVLDFMQRLAEVVESSAPAVDFNLEEFVSSYARLVELAASHRNFQGAVCLFEPGWVLCSAGLVSLSDPTDVLPTSHLRDADFRAQFADTREHHASLQEAFNAVDAGMHA